MPGVTLVENDRLSKKLNITRSYLINYYQIAATLIKNNVLICYDKYR